MGLPLSIDNVLTRERGLVGDLVITRFALYWFPHTDHSARLKRRTAAATGGAWALAVAEHLAWAWLESAGLGAVALVPLLKDQIGSTTNRSRLRKLGLWREGDSSEMLARRLDEQIASLSQTRQPLEEFSSTLPRLRRIGTKDIQTLHLNATGKLRVGLRYDDLQFRIGLRRKRLVRDALWEAGFPIGGAGL